MDGPLSRQSLCLFWLETKQRPEPAIFDVTGSGQGNASREVGQGSREGSWRQATGDGEGQLAVDTGQQKRPVGMR